MMKIYAYVKSEACLNTEAIPPGSEVYGQPVSKCGDYQPWTLGKRATLAIIGKVTNRSERLNDQTTFGWKFRTAVRVAHLMGWAS
jgi:hypothetical protein